MSTTLEFLTEQIELAEQLTAGRDTMLKPQDLPGRWGRVVKSVDHILRSMACESVLAGGWAVWRHGYEGRMTQDVDIVLPKDRIEEFLRVASVAGFEILPQPEGRWPKCRHKETGVKLDILPEGARPGSASRPAPTTIPHPMKLGGGPPPLPYISLAGLVELKLAAGRARDEADVIELMRARPDQVEALRDHLASVHPDYVAAFDRLVERARDQEDQ
jgi:hypothetical protein